MARQIVLLDDEPGLAGRHEKILKSHGYEVLRPRTMADVQLLMDAGRVGLIVHSCNKTKTHTPLCRELSEAFPDTPTLHLETGNGICRDHKRKGVLHRIAGHLGPELGFLRFVRILTALGRLKYRERVQRAILKDMENIDRLLQDLEWPRLIQVMLEQVSEWTGGDNVIWIAADDVDYFFNELWKVKTLSTAEAYVKPADERATGLEPVEPAEVTKTLLQMNRVWENRWREARLPLISDGLLVLPVTDSTDQSNMGFFIVQNPNHVKIGAKYWLSRFAGAIKQSKKFMDAKSLCYIDDVTELYNQRYLGLALDAEISRAKRNESPFSVLFMDVDHFKKINDDKGHLVGSAILKKISRILKKNIRNFDYGFRYGGDEYLLLLVNTGSGGAAAVAERIRKEVETTLFKVDGAEVHVTLSIGVASFPEHAATKEEIIALADKAMYHGKSKSRNVVFVAS